MRKISFIIISLLIAGSLSGGTPGYMGLRCILQYQGGLSPQWHDFHASPIPYYSHNVQLGYVVNRKIEVGVQYTRIDYNSNFSEYGMISPYSVIHVDHRSFAGNNAMAYIKLFRQKKGMIAPVGRYFLLGLSYQHSKDIFHTIEDDYSPAGVPVNTYVKSSDIGICFGVGKNYIFARRILLSIEADVNVPLSGIARAAMNRPNYSSENSVTGSPNFYKRMNAADVMLINLIQIKIGLGALLF